MKQFVYLILIFVFNLNAYHFKEINGYFMQKQATNKFWAQTCNAFSCQDAILNCVARGCVGKDKCTRCVTLSAPRCSPCIREIFDDNELINGNLVCDQNDDLQVFGCKIYCRGNNFANNQGDCVVENGLPVCKCTNTLPT